jgi:hypothetical protein
VGGRENVIRENGSLTKSHGAFVLMFVFLHGRWISTVKLDFYSSSPDSINSVTAILNLSHFELVFEFGNTAIKILNLKFEIIERNEATIIHH